MSLIKVFNLIDKYAKLSLIDKKYLVVFDHKSNRAQKPGDGLELE